MKNKLCSSIVLSLVMMSLVINYSNIIFVIAQPNVAPRILSVEFDKDYIIPNEWVTVTVKVINNGSIVAPYQTIHVGMPFNPDPQDVQILYTDLNMGAKIYPAGSSLGSAFGNIISKYTIVEGIENNSEPGEVKTLIIKVKMPEADALWFDVKTVACSNEWKILDSYPKIGLIDQQGEFVEPYVLLKHHRIRIINDEWNLTKIAIDNPDRYSPVSQPNIIVSSFDIIESDGFLGSIKPKNLPLILTPGASAYIELNITASKQTRLGILTFRLTANVDAASYIFKGKLSIVSFKPMAVFIGKVEKIGLNYFEASVEEIFESTTTLPGRVRVTYDSNLSSVILGKIMTGDEVLVYGNPEGEGIKILSPEYGAVNLAYSNTKDIKQLTLKGVSTQSYPFELLKIPIPTIGDLWMKGSISMTFHSEMAIELVRYGLARNGVPGVLTIAPKSGKETDELKLTLSLGISQFTRDLQASYSATTPIVLGQTSYLKYPTIPVVPFDIGLVKLKINVTPIISYVPTFIYCLVKPANEKAVIELAGFSWRLGSGIWESYDKRAFPLIILSNQYTNIDIECGVHVVNILFELNVDAEWGVLGVIGGKQSYKVTVARLEESSLDLGTTSYSISPLKLLTVDPPNDVDNITIKVNNEVYQIASKKPLRLALNPGIYTLEVPSIIPISDSERLTFQMWNIGGTSNSISLNLQNDTIASFVYITQYKVKIASEGCGTVDPAGELWVNKGSTKLFTATPQKGCTVKNWLINEVSKGTTSNPLSVVVEGPMTVKVIFTDIEPPLVKIRVSKDRVLPGEEITFDASDSQDYIGIASTQWDFGDGNYAEGIKVIHKYSKPGSYIVKLVVKDQTGNVAQENVTIRVEAPFPWIYVISAAIAISVGAIAVVYYFAKHRSKN